MIASYIWSYILLLKVFRTPPVPALMLINVIHCIDVKQHTNLFRYLMLVKEDAFWSQEDPLLETILSGNSIVPQSTYIEFINILKYIVFFNSM